MLQLLVRDYHITNQDLVKKAVIISFKKQVTGTNFEEIGRHLKDLLQKKYDTYIFYIRKKEDFSAFALKLMIAFSNTGTGKTGILVKNKKEELYTSLQLNTLFIVDSDIKTVIMQLEKAGAK